MAIVSKSIPNLLNGVSQQPFTMRLESQGLAQENCMSAVVEGLKRRPGSVFQATLSETPAYGSLFIHTIDRGDDIEKYIVMVNDGAISVYDFDGNQKTVNIDDSVYSSLYSPRYTSLSFSTPAYLQVDDPATQLKALTISDTTIIVNTTKTVMQNTPLYFGDNDGSQHSATIWLTDSADNTEYSIYVDETRVAYYEATGSDIYVVINQLYDDLVDTLGTTDWTIERNADISSTAIFLQRKDNADFAIEVTDEEYDHMHVVKEEIQDFVDLPTVCKEGQVVKVTGSPTSDYDEYYVEFNVTTGGTDDFGQGTWKETVAPGVATEYIERTMPHLLVREEDGTFTFKTAEWTERVCGDDNSNPFPSFVNNKIQSLFFFRNRLGFLSNQNVILSETNEFFNFLKTTTTTLIASDPIDLSASHTMVSDLKSAVAFQEQLLCFSKKSQFILDSGDILSLETADLKVTTDYESDTSVEPINAGNVLYFPIKRGNYAGLMEYYINEDSSTKYALSVTDHIPNYIPTNLKSIAVSTIDNIIVLLSEDEPSSLYVYKYYWAGEEKLQSSWSRWTFPDVEILNIGFLDSRLYMITSGNDGICLEYLPLEPYYTDPGEPIEYHLDRKVTEEEITTAFNSEDQVTTITLPYKVDPDALPMIVTRTGSEAPGTILAHASIPTGESYEIKVEGDHTNTPLIIGIPYESTYTFAHPYIRETKGNSELVVTTGRLQIHWWTLSVADTCGLKLLVTPDQRDTFEYLVSGQVVGDPDFTIGEISSYSGDAKIPIFAKNDKFTLVAESITYLPFNILSVDWEGNYTARSQRI